MLLHLCWQDYSTLAVCEVAWEVAHPGTLVVEHKSEYRSSLDATLPHTCGNTDIVQEMLPMEEHHLLGVGGFAVGAQGHYSANSTFRIGESG